MGGGSPVMVLTKVLHLNNVPVPKVIKTFMSFQMLQEFANSQNLSRNRGTLGFPAFITDMMGCSLFLSLVPLEFCSSRSTRRPNRILRSG